MTLSEKIKQIYPSIQDSDFAPKTGTIILQDDSDGNGTYIKSWTNSNPRPTQEQLDALN